MRKVVVVILIFVSLVVLTIRFATDPLVGLLGLKGRAGLRVESTPKAKVLIDNRAVGTTPFLDENLTEGEYLVSLATLTEATDSARGSWQGYVRLNSGTLAVVNRELMTSPAASSGEVITLEKGGGVTIISSPSNAEVMADGRLLGRTPLSLTAIPSGEHQFLISRESFLKRSIRATVVDGFNLTLQVDLAISEADLTKIPTVPMTASQQVVVRQTPTGFLRVRSNPSVESVEIARVLPGDELTLLEEFPNWNRIRLPDGKEGYVSSTYTEKKAP